MYSCRETTALASDYLERELSWWARLQFRLHLWMCDRCSRLVRQIQATIVLVRGRRAALDRARSGPAGAAPPALGAAERALVERFRAAHPPEG